MVRDASGLTTRVLVVTNPRLSRGERAVAWRRFEGSLLRSRAVARTIETAARGGDASHVTALIEAEAPHVIVAAGGDGTVGEVVHGIMNAREPRPPLAVLPLGTANNVARSLGLPSCRSAHDVDVALATALSGGERAIDVGRVGERFFAGSFAIGMDADILRTRNRARPFLGQRSRLAGYPLYLASCALHLAVPHGAPARLVRDGENETTRAYNLLVMNTSLYAGEFRFGVAGEFPDDGLLDVYPFGGPSDYVRHFVAAWVRQLRSRAGVPVSASVRARRFRELTIDLERPVAAQVDGEDVGDHTHHVVTVAARSLRVRTPSVGRRQ